MKRKASNLIILLVLIAGIVGVILYARGKQLTPSYGPSESSGTKMDSSDLPSGSAGLVLSELMVENDKAVRDEDGDYPRWVELYNSTAGDLSLSGYSLSDRDNDATKYPLPSITLSAGEYRVVFLSGKNRAATDGNLHASFKLSSDETLYLFSGANPVDSVSGSST